MPLLFGAATSRSCDANSGLAWNLIKRAITRTLQAVKELLVEMNHVWMLDAYVIPTDKELLIVRDTGRCVLKAPQRFG